VIYISLQPPRNQTLHPTFEPNLPQQRIIPLLVEEKLVVTTQRGVDFAVLVEIRGHVPGTVVEIEKENHAFADMYEEADLAAASVGLTC
jgi:hypothetical protein